MPARMTRSLTNTNAPIKKRLSSTLLFFLLILFAADGSLNAVRASDKLPATAFIAIIIDDLGYKLQQDQRAINLPGQVTFAFLPQTPHVRALAETANAQGNEIMLHLPMQSVEPLFLGPGALTQTMNREEFKISLLKSILSIPHVKGINNHMGSLITSQKQPMNWLMEEIARTRLFFVDSRTTVETLAEQTANQYQIANTRRNVFLDHERNRPAIEFQFDQLIQLARKNGSAVAIGHPYAETLDVLEEKIPQLKAAGIRLIPVSELIHQQYLIAKARQKAPWNRANALAQTTIDTNKNMKKEQ